MVELVSRDPEPLVVAQRAYDILRDAVPTIDRFSRDRRFTLGERLEETLLDLLLLLRRLRFVRDRAPVFDAVDESLDRARVLWRLACDWRQVSVPRYGQAIEALGEIGRMLGGLARRSTLPAAEPPAPPE